LKPFDFIEHADVRRRLGAIFFNGERGCLGNFKTRFRNNPEKGFSKMGVPQQLIPGPGKCNFSFFDEKRFGRHP
jgi:hypothetical protein